MGVLGAFFLFGPKVTQFMSVCKLGVVDGVIPFEFGGTGSIGRVGREALIWIRIGEDEKE